MPMLFRGESEPCWNAKTGKPLTSRRHARGAMIFGRLLQQMTENALSRRRLGLPMRALRPFRRLMG